MIPWYHFLLTPIGLRSSASRRGPECPQFAEQWLPFRDRTLYADCARLPAADRDTCHRAPGQSDGPHYIVLTVPYTSRADITVVHLTRSWHPEPAGHHHERSTLTLSRTIDAPFWKVTAALLHYISHTNRITWCA